MQTGTHNRKAEKKMGLHKVKKMGLHKEKKMGLHNGAFRNCCSSANTTRMTGSVTRWSGYKNKGNVYEVSEQKKNS
jgi:hypothetical protein